MGRDSQASDDTFISGAIMDNIDLCAQTIECDTGGVWNTETDKTPGPTGSLPGKKFLDPSTWPLRNYTICPAVYMYALQRTYQKDGQASGSDRANMFRSIMAACKEGE